MKRRMGSVSTPIESPALEVVEISPVRTRASRMEIQRTETSQDSVAIQDEQLLQQ